jgi:adenosine deaminase
MFDTSLEKEYTSLMETFGFELADIKKLIANGIRSAWCDESTRKKLLDDLARSAV